MKPVMQPYTVRKHKAVTAIRSLAIRKSAKLFNAKGENEDGEDFAWVMSNPRWIDKPFAVKGFIGMWTMKPADAKKVMAQL